MYLRIKSKIRKIKKIRPMYNIFSMIIEIIKDNQVVKHNTQEKSFNKNLIENDLEKHLLLYRYSM